jgi:hypothetical protein
MNPLPALLCVLATLAASTPAHACGELLKGEMVAAQRDLGAAAAGESRTHHVLGAGWLRAIEVTKQGGASDETAVTLELDGVPVISTTFAALQNPWMQLDTPLMGASVRSDGDTRVLTVWYTQELRFTTMAAVRIDVQEHGVAGLSTRTVMNKPAPHEHVGGQAIGPTATVLPAFQ